jgi:hypothetical protein
VFRIALAASCLTALAVATAATAHVFAIRGDAKLGAYAVRADGSLRGAISAFGDPTSRERRSGGSACTTSWRRHGLSIDFYNLGGSDPCSPEGGRFSRAVMRGDHWVTTKRLRIGDSVRKLRQLYPGARLEPGTRGFWPAGYWLLRRYSPIGVGGYYPGLLAEIRNGKVVGFHVRFAAGGD